VRYDRAYSTSSWTLPAHASILTGVSPNGHGIHNNTRFRLDARPDIVIKVTQVINGVETVIYLDPYAFEQTSIQLGAGSAENAGGGLNFRPNHAFEIRLATLEYEHTWLAPMNGIEYRNAIKVSGGLVVRMGTW